jgi:hypothetical protein
MTTEDLSKLRAALCRAGTALDKMQGEDDPTTCEILRDAAHKAVSDGLDVFETASIAA